MRKEPKIGIFMACYNHEKYVGQAMDSIINQTYKNWELFVANDGSTDNTGKIIESYKDSRIHYFDFKVNTKRVGAINFLYKQIEARDFDYVHSMASDDYLDEDKFRQQIEFFKKNPQYKVCFTWDKVVFDNGKPYYETYSHKKNMNRYEWVAHYFKYENCMNANSVMIEKKLFFEHGGLNEFFIQNGDFKMWFEFAAKMPFYVIEKELAFYRRHESNLSNVTLQRLIRTANEQMVFVKNIIFNMDKDCFCRSFFNSLPYTDIENDSELWAAKFYLLATAKKATTDSMALDVYYSHCNDAAFTDLLENKYFFSSRELYEFSGNAGMGWLLQELFKLEIERSDKKVMGLCEILLEAIDRKKLRYYMQEHLNYSVLLDLYGAIEQIENGRPHFERIKSVVQQCRKEIWESKKGSCLVMVGADSDWSPSSEFVAKCDAAQMFFTYVNKREDAMLKKPIDLNSKRIPDGFSYVDLLDEKEMSMTFANKKIDNLQTIYLVDCISDEYETMDMIAGYPLLIEQHLITKKELLEKMGNVVPRQTVVVEDMDVY